MNSETLKAVTGILGMINPALGVIGSIVGSFGSDNAEAKFEKVSGALKDAAGVVTALTPLLDQAANGEELTLEDARVALDGKDDARAAFDKLIAAKGG